MNRLSKFLLLIFFLIYGCSDKFTKRYESKFESTIKIRVDSLKSWVETSDDLNYFNISGILYIPESPGYNLEDLKLETVEVIEGEEVRFYIKPLFKGKIIERKKKIVFTTIKGLRSRQKINDSSYIYCFIFNENTDKFKFYYRGK